MADQRGGHGLNDERIRHELEISRVAPEEATVDGEAVESDGLVRDEEGPIERRPVCCALNRTAGTGEVDQHLVRSNAARQRQRAVEAAPAVAGDVDHDYWR